MISALAPLRDQAFDVGQLLLGELPRRPDVLGAGGFQSALIAASSVFQRSSWKFDQLT
jgi:hypothetical protein